MGQGPDCHFLMCLPCAALDLIAVLQGCSYPVLLDASSPSAYRSWDGQPESPSLVPSCAILCHHVSGGKECACRKCLKGCGTVLFT